MRECVLSHYHRTPAPPWPHNGSINRRRIMDINAIIQLVIVAAVGYSLIALIMPGLRR